MKGKIKRVNGYKIFCLATRIHEDFRDDLETPVAIIAFVFSSFQNITLRY